MRIEERSKEGQPCWLDTPAHSGYLAAGFAPSYGQHYPFSASLREVFKLSHRWERKVEIEGTFAPSGLWPRSTSSTKCSKP